MTTTSASYKLVSRDLDQSLEITAKQPQNARETAYYREKIGSIKSIEEFLKDDRVYRYAMKAFGLDDMIYAKGFIKKVLTEGLETNRSFANTLSDPRFREFAKTFNFKADGEKATQSTDAKQGTIDRFVRLSLEKNQGEQNEGVRLALYFARKAPTLRSTLGILADKALLKVAQTAFDIPASSAGMDIDKQAAMLATRIKVEDLKDPVKLNALLERFTIRWDIANPSTTSSPSVPSIQVGRSGVVGINTNILASLQNLRLGGN